MSRNVTFIYNGVILCNMKDTIRLTKALQEILYAYSDDAGRAIKDMQIRITHLETECIRLKAVADTLQVSQKVTPTHWTNTGPPAGTHDKKYWDELKEKVKEVLIELQGG